MPETTGAPLNLELPTAGGNTPLRAYVHAVAQAVNDYLSSMVTGDALETALTEALDGVAESSDPRFPVVTEGKTLTVENSITLAAATDGSTIEFPRAGAVQIRERDGIRKRLTPPALGFTMPCRVVKQAGIAVTDFNPERYKVTGKAYYVDGTNGNNANDGLTPGTALQTLTTAYNKADVKIIYVLPGVYAYGVRLPTIAKDLSIIGLGDVKITMRDSAVPVWTVHSGNTYSAPGLTAAATMWDTSRMSAWGDYEVLAKKNSIADVVANPGSWCVDSGVHYVHMADGRAPDANLARMVGSSSTFPISVRGGYKFYMENIQCEGGAGHACELRNTSAADADRPRGVYVNCSFKYAVSNGFAFLGAHYAYFLNCRASSNKADGFNYHALNGVGGHFVEIDCYGAGNGVDATTSINNGTTSHEAIPGARINCEYNSNRGPNVADIQACKIWCVCCEAYNSLAATNNANFQVTDAGTEMWLDTCYSHDSPKGLESLTVGAVVYTRDTVNEGNTANVSAVGTVTDY